MTTANAVDIGEKAQAGGPPAPQLAGETPAPKFAGETPAPQDLELSATEKKFLKRIVAKFGSTRRKPLLQSLIVITVLVTAAHLIERSGLPWWAAFLLVYIPTIYMFNKYRRFGIFKSKLMRKLALREEAFAERRP